MDSPPAPPPYDGSKVRRFFTRGRERPRGIIWFGLGAFWGHLRHFAASAIATEDIDSRDWMSPDSPRELVQRIAQRLGAPQVGATLTESLDRDVWVDYLADTGDDVSVSRAVARLVFTEYRLPDPSNPGETLLAPRGDVLLFGGDTAYPVATAEEITNRVVVPFNQVLTERPVERSRVILGIPGNHDWYDGLDGFGRMFRRHVGDVGAPESATLHRISRTMLSHYADWAREFMRGGRIEKPKTLELLGYTPAQSASYFILPVAPAVVLLAVDRQLKELDSRQKHFFQSWLSHHLAVAPWVLLPDPVYPFGYPSPSAEGMARAIGLNFKSRPHFVLSGDIHHYRRESEGRTLHVTAGGGGAFLHPAPIVRRTGRPPDVEWPDPVQSRALLWNAPYKIALGRSGILPHVILGALYAPAVFYTSDLVTSPAWLALALVPLTLMITTVYSLIGGIRRGRSITLLVAFASAIPTAVVPVVVSWAFGEVLKTTGVTAFLQSCIALAVAATMGSFLFGSYLVWLTLLGLENTQAFTALDHPGFKHFVRLRVRKDGSAIDGWVIGVVNPLGKESEPVVVDRFTWESRW